MSVFAGALGTLRRIVANVPFDPAEALDALDLIEQRATELEAELAHLKSEYNFEGDRGDHLIYRDEWERFDRWQRAMEPL